MDKLLMLGTTNGSRALILEAKRRGVYTIVTDYLPTERSAAKQISDEYWMISTNDLDALEQECRKSGVTGVISGVHEFNQDMAIALSKRLGLPCYCTEDAWRISRNKFLFKQLCHEVGAPVATDYDVSDRSFFSHVRFPVVVKPVDLSGNRGISYCQNKTELVKAVDYAKSQTKHPDKIICERMLNGEEWYSMYALSNGKASLVSLCAMYSQPGEPKNCYTITTTVSNHVEKYITEINPQIERVLAAAGCTNGIAWVQVMLDADGHFYIIEMGYRGDGELMFIPLKDVVGFDAVKWMVDDALGVKHGVDELPLSQKHAFRRCACGIDLFTNRGGVVKSVEGFDEISNAKGVYADCHAFIGREIKPYSTVGVVAFSANDCAEMCDMIKKVNDTIHVYNEKGEDVIIKYRDFDYLMKVYKEGLEGQQ